MGIENYEEKAKNRKFDEEKRGKSPKEIKEEKEKEEAVTEAVRVCAEYHDKLDVTGYFNSKAAQTASGLLPAFLHIKRDRLPESLQNVLNHRIAYLTMMAELNKNRGILNLLDKLAPRFLGSQGLFDKNFNTVKSECEKFPEFKRLEREDFQKAYSIVVKGIGHLQAVNKNTTNWQHDAQKHLQNRKYKFSDKRVDDRDAARNLQAGLQTAAKNLRMLEVRFSNRGV